MPSKIIQSVSIIAVFIFAVSCTVHRGQVISLDHGQQVPLNDRAIGSASVSYLLSIGGNRTKTLLNDAKADMLVNRPLGPNEKYVNIKFDVATSYYLLYFKQTYTLTADVIDTTASLSFVEKIPFCPDSLGCLHEKTDSIFDKKNEFVGYFIQFNEDEKIKYWKNDGSIKTIKPKKVYTRKGSRDGFKVGQTIIESKDFPEKGIIVAIGYESVLVKDQMNSIWELKYGKFERWVAPKKEDDGKVK